MAAKKPSVKAKSASVKKKAPSVKAKKPAVLVAVVKSAKKKKQSCPLSKEHLRSLFLRT